VVIDLSSRVSWKVFVVSLLRIAFLTDYLSNLSGTESSIAATCQMLRNAGDEVFVFCYSQEGRVHHYWKHLLQKAGVRMIEQPAERHLGGVPPQVFCRSIADSLGTWHPHLIHAIPLGPLGLTWITCGLLPDVPTIGTETGPASSRCSWYDPETFRQYAGYKAIIASSKRVRSGIKSYFGYDGPVPIIPSIVPVPEEEIIPLTLDELKHVHSLGSISRLRVEKGPEFMVAALSLLATTHPTVTLTIYGETPEIERTRQVAQALGVADRLFLPGPFRASSEIDGVIRRHCIFLLPSMFEGLPRSLLEAIARGRVIVASDVGGVSEILDSTSAGIVVPPGNPQALADAVASLFDDWPSLITRGKTGIQRFRERYHVNVVFPALRKFYLEIAKQEVRFE
jgi:glycosyltransferase involved in cell wall biosynthesis